MTPMDVARALMIVMPVVSKRVFVLDALTCMGRLDMSLIYCSAVLGLLLWRGQSKIDRADKNGTMSGWAQDDHCVCATTRVWSVLTREGRTAFEGQCIVRTWWRKQRGMQPSRLCSLASRGWKMSHLVGDTVACQWGLGQVCMMLKRCVYGEMSVR